MKRIYSFLFAILTLAATTGVFTSCQEDAPEIDYTINITVNNDFTEVVNAINNGTMKQEAAIAALTAAINSMNGEQNEKMDAIVKAINDLAKTTDAKLAIIEAAMKAQTLALENKLALLETAIKNIPDYSEKMDAIEAAIKNAPDYTTALEEIKEAIADAEDNFVTQLGLLITAIDELPDYGAQLTAIKDAIPTIPNYEDQFGALELALEAIAEKIEAQEGQYADGLAALKTSIDAITKAVEDGNKSQEDALAEIIALLESGAIAGGGSGSGSGGSEDATPFVKLGVYSDWKRNSDDDFYCCTVSIEDAETVEFEGATELESLAGFSDLHWLKLDAQIATIKVSGNFSDLAWDNNGYLKSIDISNYPGLQYLDIAFCRHVESITISKEKNTELSYLNCRDCEFNDEEMTALVESLPDRTDKEPGTFIPKNDPLATKDYENFLSSDNVNKAKAKNWKVVDDEGNELLGD